MPRASNLSYAVLCVYAFLHLTLWNDFTKATKRKMNTVLLSKYIFPKIIYLKRSRDKVRGMNPCHGIWTTSSSLKKTLPTWTEKAISKVQNDEFLDSIEAKKTLIFLVVWKLFLHVQDWAQIWILIWKFICNSNEFSDFKRRESKMPRIRQLFNLCKEVKKRVANIML